MAHYATRGRFLYAFSERLADEFAGYFLMPTNGITRRFNDIRRTSKAITPADLCTLASYYGVSVEAMTWHIPEITCISTIDIFKYWVDTLSPTTQVIEKAARSMGKRALHMPSVNHRWYSWWNMWRG